MKRRVTVEIDLKALVRNYRRIAAHCRPAKVLCVLKANAYGLGVADYAKALAKAGCTMFGVAEPYEALELKKVFASARSSSGSRNSRTAEVQMLSSVLPDEIPEMVKAGVILPDSTVGELEMSSCPRLSSSSRKIIESLGLKHAELRKTTPLKFACRCSSDRAIAMLAALSDEERKALPPSIDITCHMCGKTFTVKTK